MTQKKKKIKKKEFWNLIEKKMDTIKSYVVTQESEQDTKDALAPNIQKQILDEKAKQN